MSLGSFQGAAASAALAAGVSLVSILQAGDWAKVSTPARHYFSPYITTTTTVIFSLAYVGLSAIAVPSTKQIVPQLSVQYQH